MHEISLGFPRSLQIYGRKDTFHIFSRCENPRGRTTFGKNHTISSNPSQGSNASQGSSSARGILPKQATELMQAGLFALIVHPYPSEEEEELIAKQTYLAPLQASDIQRSYIGTTSRCYIRPFRIMGFLEVCARSEESEMVQKSVGRRQRAS